MSMRGRTVVIGAGIAGVSTAIWLRRAGQEVTLVDRQEPGKGASYGNAGVLAACSVAPVTAPGLVKKAPFLLMNRDSPLFLVWERLPSIVPWLVRYLSHANDKDTRRIARGLATLVSDSPKQHRELAAGTGAERWLYDSDYIFAYESRQAFESDGYTWELRRAAGFEPVQIEGPAVKDILPSFGFEGGLLAVMKNHGFVSSPGKYVGELAASLEAAGGTVAQAEVKDFQFLDGRIQAVETNAGRIECGTAVVAAGAWSKTLMQKIGLRVPLETERGYHVVFKNPTMQLSAPVMVASGKFVATPMDGGLRCAGVLEFGGLSPPPSRRPLELIRKKVLEAFPDLSWDGEEEWLGHRPAPSDSLPLIGEVGSSGLYTAFGHHHIGLTAGPKTGRAVANLIVGAKLPLDISAFSPNRFRQRV